MMHEEYYRCLSCGEWNDFVHDLPGLFYIQDDRGSEEESLWTWVINFSLRWMNHWHAWVSCRRARHWRTYGNGEAVVRRSKKAEKLKSQHLKRESQQRDQQLWRTLKNIWQWYRSKTLTKQNTPRPVGMSTSIWCYKYVLEGNIKATVQSLLEKVWK